jgi:hypothetical protein
MRDNVQRRPYAVIEAPSILGLKPTGVDRLARTLPALDTDGAAGVAHECAISADR